MFPDQLIHNSKLTPPRLHRDILHRQRLNRRLLEAVEYRITVIQAGTGYGKTTALTELVKNNPNTVWLHVDPEDSDPLTFLLYLINGFSWLYPHSADVPLALLESWERDPSATLLSSAADALTNSLTEAAGESIYLILDDAHMLNDSMETLQLLDRIVGRCPPNVHIILASRYPIKLPNRAHWRVKNELLEINQEELAFNKLEIGSLFREAYGIDLTPTQIELLLEKSEGWPMALQLVRQRLRSGGDLSVSQAIEQLATSSGDLFTFLAQEVLDQQPADIQNFLSTTSVLRQMTATSCDCLLERTDSDEVLGYLLENDLFVVDLGNGLVRYHHLFRQLLQNQLSENEAADCHRRAAGCFQQLGDSVEAVYHLLAAPDYGEAARILVDLGRSMVHSGRLENLSTWMGALPPDALEEHPPLLVYLGDIARLKSRFQEALGWYEQAQERSLYKGDVPGLGQALRGQARVYLDTLDSDKADQLLREALKLAEGQEDRQSRARIMELLAENLINRGQMDEAEKYQIQARELREEGPAAEELPVRLLLRTGRLQEAQAILEARAEKESRQPVRQPRAHRETPLLLSLVMALQGDQKAAFYWAEKGIERGEQLESQFISAVGLMRQGHAWLLKSDEEGFANAAACFDEALRISERIDVSRIRGEANWGLCQVYGFQGDLGGALMAADDGIQIARAAGDAWLEADIRLSMGAVYCSAVRLEDAAIWLEEAGKAFLECSDTHGEAAVRLWQCLVWNKKGDQVRLLRDVEALLKLTKESSFFHFFRQRTLLGPLDSRELVPILIFARDNHKHRLIAQNLLRELGLDGIQYHPGYQLRVQMLGQFRIWRGRQEIAPDEWKRRKARSLLMLLLLNKGASLEREQISDALWPELGPDEAQRDQKISMSALYGILEPSRKRNSPSSFIARDGSLYGWRMESDYQLDTDLFDTQIDKGDRLYDDQPLQALPHYKRAMELYSGDLLQEFPYEEWTYEIRERLLSRFLTAAEKAARMLLEIEDYDGAVSACQAILTRDPCWESAYRMMMEAYIQLGQATQALRTYQRCEKRLREDLSIEPSTATKKLYHSVLQLEDGA